VYRYAEQRYALRRLCMSASVLGAGVHGIRAWVIDISGISSTGVCGVGGVGGSEHRSDMPEKVSRPSVGLYIVAKWDQV
jgi:hypothetical protein